MSASDRPTLTLREAADAARVSAKTIRRRLTAGAFPNAYRQDSPHGPATGPWAIPVDDLLAAGFTLHASHPEPAPAAPDQDVADLRERLARAEATAEQLDRRVRDLQDALDFERTTLRALMAGQAAPEPVQAPPGPAEHRAAPGGLLGTFRRFLGG